MSQYPSRVVVFATTALVFSGIGYGFQKAESNASPGNPDYSKESFVIERLTNDASFTADGKGQIERAARIRIQSDAAIQALGVLRFPYRNAFERVEIVYIRVIKPDGSVVPTPDSEVQEVPAEVTRLAPAYSDSREKQVPVKGLSVGDVLEWRVRTVRTVADIPGQFWYDYDFVKDGVVVEETVNVAVPAGKYVKVSSPDLAPTVRNENDQVIYSWKTSQVKVAKEGAEEKPSPQPTHTSIQVTSFRNWEEVGQWYGDLQKSQIRVTPAIQAKTAEVIRGANTATEKQRAIYEFVSTKFRYISISFGEGRYQPHSADEVLSNQYGDCKDKHTLLSTMLSAAGIPSWPVLIGAGIDFDPDMPSPAQFNHVITYVPGTESALWLDTTPEVAPFGMLQDELRNKQALVIPLDGAPRVMTTPDTIPFAADETIIVTSKLSGEGTLTGHFDITVRGDDEIGLKGAFHATAPAQWTQMAQNMAGAMGYAGKVRGVAVDNPTNIEAPFHYSYDYERTNYSDWGNLRFTPPVPLYGFEGAAEQEKPVKPYSLGAPGKLTFRARIQLPEGYSVAIPDDANLQADFADYHATYTAQDGILAVERIVIRKQPRVPLDQWAAFQKFAKGVADDETQFIQLARSGGSVTFTRDNEEAGKLVQQAVLSVQKREYTAASDALAEAERLNPQQTGLWAAYGFLYGMQNQVDRALEALQKEIEFHPGNLFVYQPLAAAQRQAGRKEAATQTLRLWVKAAPGNVDAILALTADLIAGKQYKEAAESLKTAVKNNPDNVRLNTGLLETLVRSGQKDGVSDLLAKLQEQKLAPEAQNDIAYMLADTNTEPAFAQGLAEKAVAGWEEQSKSSTLASVTTADLRRVVSLGATWDTLGWAYFRNGDLVKAEKFLQAAWILLQVSASADHLGQLYERQGKKAEAIHFYRLAIAAHRDSPETRDRLEKLGGTADDRVTLRRGRPGSALTVSAEDELSQMRSIPVPNYSQRDGHAEFFVLLSPKGVIEANFISGDPKLKEAASILPKINFKLPFPDDGPEKIVRRGILSCSPYTTPLCSFVLLLPGSTEL